MQDQADETTGQVPDLLAAMPAFTDYMSRERGFSHHTCTAYRRDVQDLIVFLDGAPVTTSGVRQWLAAARDRGVGCRGWKQGSENRAGTVKWLERTDDDAVDFNAGMQEGLVASDGKRIEFGLGSAATWR